MNFKGSGPFGERLARRVGDQQVLVIIAESVAGEKDQEKAREYRVKLRVVA